MSAKTIAENINILGEFCGMRDVPSLTKEQLYKKYGVNKADLMVLFGGSIICGGDILAEAIKNNIAKKYIIVGGAGHTTEALRKKVESLLPKMVSEGMTEAEIFTSYLKYKYDLSPDLIESKSTNCGNNITLLLDLLKENNLSFESIILVQDATMQRRMDAVLRKYVSKSINIINFAAYSAKVIYKDNKLNYYRDILGMWTIERYISLLMGEIPRLQDDENGYGPQGKDFISHVDISEEVMNAFKELEKEYSAFIRRANPIYG